MRPHRTLRRLPLVLLPLLASSCGDSGPPPLASIAVSPGSVTLTFIGESRTLTVTLTDEAGQPRTDIAVTWTSSNPGAVEVSPAGVLTARGPGGANVTASASGITSNTVAVSVAQRAATIEVSQATVAMTFLGETRTLTASARDQGGADIANATFTWTSTFSSVATITPGGVLTAQGNGSTVVRASADGSTSAPVTVTVAQRAVGVDLTTPGPVILRSVGETLQLTLAARDAGSRAIANPAATWTSSNQSAATVSPGGLLRAVADGQTQVTVSVDGVESAPLTVTVAQEVAGVEVDPDIVVLGTAGNTAQVTARAVDALGSTVPGIAFAWTTGNPGVATVDPAGETVTITAGNDGGTLVTATGGGFNADVEVIVGAGTVKVLQNGDRVDGLFGPTGLQRFYRITVPAGAGELHVGTGGGTGDLDLFVRFGQQPNNDFNDTGQFASGNSANEEQVEILDPQAGDWFILVDGFAAYSDASLQASYRVGAKRFNIDLRFISNFTQNQRNVIRQAADRWEAVLPADLFSLWARVDGAQNCVTGLGENSLVEDLLVYVGVQATGDGVGGTLASAGPCFIRIGGGQDNLPIIGVMGFDPADLPGLEASGRLALTALHEFGHVLGFGSLWAQPNPPLIQGAGTADPIFVGPLARQAFDAVGGAAYQGQKVPVENTGGAGTADGHWRESVFDTELMTGFAEGAGAEALSIVTVQSMADLGWTVDVNQADAYQLPQQGGGAAERAARLEGTSFGNDIEWVDLYGITRDGKVTLIRRGRR